MVSNDMETKRIALLFGLLLAWGASPFAFAGSLITNPAVLVSPRVLDFGMVASNAVATNMLVVENAGGGRLIGTAKVAAPFRILSGEEYSLGRTEAQVITLTYSPTGVGGDSGIVTFTGGSGATVSVTGYVAGASAPEQKPRKGSRR
jgi:hypothetical protein